MGPSIEVRSAFTTIQVLGALLTAAIFGAVLAWPAAADGAAPGGFTQSEALTVAEGLDNGPASSDLSVDEATVSASEIAAPLGQSLSPAGQATWTDPNTGELQWRFPGIVIPVPIFCRGPVEPLPAPPPPPANPGPAGAATYQVCPQAAGRVPPAVQQYALANPHAIQGYGEYRNPNVPPSPWNQLRTWLHLRDPGKPFSLCNSVVWKAGCY